MKDSSLRLPHGDRGKVIDVKVFTRDEHPDLPAGVEKMVRASVAQRRKLTVGDKMAGGHGNKGVLYPRSCRLQDMPYIDGGIPVEIILNLWRAVAYEYRPDPGVALGLGGRPPGFPCGDSGVRWCTRA